MSVQPKDYEIHHDHDWPSFLEIQANKLRHHIAELRVEISYLETDRLSGWLAAVMLLCVLGYVLYLQLNVANVDLNWLYLAAGMVFGCLLGGGFVATASFWLALLRAKMRGWL